MLRAFETTIAALEQNPFRFQVVHRNLRRVGLGRFPYGLFYAVSETDIIIVACIHASRDPKLWKRRVCPDRETSCPSPISSPLFVK